MNVTDLLHLQASFHADSIVNSASDEENIMGICILACKPLDTLFIIQNTADLVRQGLHLSKQTGHFSLLKLSLDKSTLDSQQIHDDQLGAVSLGGGNRNLRSCISI